MSNQLVKLGVDGRPLEPEYPLIEGHVVPEMNGEVNWDAGDVNRFEMNFFALYRARILALFGAAKIDAKEALGFIQKLDESRMNDEFGDESQLEVNDANVISVIKANSAFTSALQHMDEPWLKPFVDCNGKATETQCKNFGGYLKTAVEILSGEIVRIVSDEQLVFYSHLAEFLLSAENGVGFN